MMITGALRLGLITAAQDELDGREMHDLAESLRQMSEGRMSEVPEDLADVRGYMAEVEASLTRLGQLQAEHGQKKGAVMFLTDLTAEQVEELGGINEEGSL